MLTWVGGGERRELDEQHERSAHAIAGVVVILTAALAWLVTTVAVLEATSWPVLAVLPITLVFGVLVGAITRGVASGPIRGLRGIVGRGLVAVAVGLAVGEFAALAVFSGSIDHQLALQAARNADSTPAVLQASANLAQLRTTRVALDKAVDTARVRRDEALVVARCEYHPTPACPQTRITGVPGSGPETRTANELLADSQQELDTAIASRDRQAAELDPKIADGERALSQARQSVIADADHGLAARWLAMQELTLAGAGAVALMLRLLIIAFFILLSLLPLILRLWRGETAHDRHATARAERERAELDAETAIAVKRAEVRAAAETLWAEQQLVQARMAVEAQTEIDRAQLRRRVDAELEGPKHAAEPVAEDIYLPIAAEAEAASMAAIELPDAAATADETPNLPATVETSDVPATPSIPTIPDVTKAAARWIRPLVPGFVARAIDTSTHPLRTARQVFEEVEEITFSFRRTHKITVDSEESAGQGATGRPAGAGASDGDHSGAQHIAAQRVTPERLSAKRVDDLPLAQGESRRGLTEREGPRQVRAADGPRQLPPAE
jgi:hypothetical protein